MAAMNNWDDLNNVAYLATRLKDPALAVVGNLAPEDHQNLDALIVALKNHS